MEILKKLSALVLFLASTFILQAQVGPNVWPLVDGNGGCMVSRGCGFVMCMNETSAPDCYTVEIITTDVSLNTFFVESGGEYFLQDNSGNTYYTTEVCFDYVSDGPEAIITCGILDPYGNELLCEDGCIVVIDGR